MRQKIELMFRSKATMKCIPLALVQKKNKMFFNVLFEEKEKLVSVERLTGIKILKEKFYVSDKDKLVIFKLYGNLARNYKLKAGEQQTVTNYPEYVSITNYCDSKEVLISRLLRYDTKCEIQHPLVLREQMKATIDAILANYGE